MEPRPRSARSAGRRVPTRPGPEAHSKADNSMMRATVAALERFPMRVPRPPVALENSPDGVLRTPSRKDVPHHSGGFPQRPLSARRRQAQQSPRSSRVDSSSSPRAPQHEDVPAASSTPTSVHQSTYTEAQVGDVVDSVTSELHSAFVGMYQAQAHRYELMLHRLYHVMLDASGDGGIPSYERCREVAEQAEPSTFEPLIAFSDAKDTDGDSQTAKNAHVVVKLRKQFDRIVAKHERPLAKTAAALRLSDTRMKEAAAELREMEHADAAALALQNVQSTQAAPDDSAPLRLLLGMQPEPVTSAAKPTTARGKKARRPPPEAGPEAKKRPAPRRKTAVQFDDATDTGNRVEQEPVDPLDSNDAGNGDGASSHSSRRGSTVAVDEPPTTPPEGACWSFADLRQQVALMSAKIDDTLASTASPAEARRIVLERRRAAEANIVQVPSLARGSPDQPIGLPTGDDGEDEDVVGVFVCRPRAAGPFYGFDIACQTVDDAPSDGGLAGSVGGERGSSASPLAGVLGERIGLLGVSGTDDGGATPTPDTDVAGTQTTGEHCVDSAVQTGDDDGAADTAMASLNSSSPLTEHTAGDAQSTTEPPPPPPPPRVLSPGALTTTQEERAEETSAEQSVRIVGTPSEVAAGPAASRPADDRDVARGDDERREAAPEGSPTLGSPRRRGKSAGRTASSASLNGSTASSPGAGGSPLKRQSSVARRVQLRDVEVDARVGPDLLEPLLNRERKVDDMQRTFNNLFYALSTTAQSLMLYTDGYESELVCRCCLRFVQDPVVLWPCGHSFCKSCIEAEMATVDHGTGEKSYTCRDCREVSHEGYVTNVTLAALAGRWNFKKRTVAEPAVTISALRDSLEEVAATGEAGAQATAAAFNPPVI